MATFNAGAIEATLDLDVDPFQRGIALARSEGRKFAGETFKATLDVDDRKVSGKAATARRQLERYAQTYTADIDLRGAAEAIAQAETLNAALAGVGGDRAIDLDVSSGGTAASIGNVRRGLRSLIAPLAIVSTGLIPLTAAAVPVLGLANNLTLAAGAAGAMALALPGVPAAFKAIGEADLEPNAENLEKMHAAMSKLAPDAREFVEQVRSMSGEASALQRTAAAGMFPAVNAGLKDVDLSDYNSLVYTLANVGGEQLGGMLESLDNPRWVEFFGFLEAEARPGVDALGDSVGNLAGFFTSLWQAFDPLNDDFSDWLVGGTADLRDWADSLREGGANAGEFGEFIAYVREQGPEAGEALSAVGGAITDVVVAAAPLGGVVLDALEGVGNAISFIAKQPFGDELLLGAAALFTFNKALGATSGLLTRMGMGPAAGTAAAGAGSGFGGLFSGVQEKASAASKGVRGFRDDLRTVGTTAMTAGARTERELTRSREAATRLRGTMSTVGKGAAGIGAVTVAATGLGDSLHISNMAMGALMGTMIAPGLGTGIGAAAGYVLDLADATGRAADTAKQWRDAFSDAELNVVGQRDLIGQAREQYNAYVDDVTSSNVGEYLANSFDPTVIADFTKEAFGQEIGSELLERNLADLEKRANAVREAAGVFAEGFGENVSPDDYAGLTGVLERAAPAMQALKISATDLENADETQLRAYANEIERWQTYADSGAGRMEAFADSVTDLGQDALSTADSAAQMTAALEALLSPTLNLEQATDDWHAALRTLEKDLKASAGFKANTAAAAENRQMTRDYVTSSMERLGKLAEVSTTTEGDMARAVAQTRREFIESGVAAGFSRKAMVARANAMKLTPKLVRTIFKAAGIDEVDLRARRLREVYRSLPRNVRTDLKANGIPETMADVDKLDRKYRLTEKERQALIRLKDLASKDIGDILEKLGLVDRTNPSPTINVISSAAQAALDRAMDQLNALDGKTARSVIEIHTVRTGAGGQGRGYGGGSDGTTVPKTPYGYADRHAYLLADGEEVVRNRHGQADEWRPLLKAINDGLADGGTVRGLSRRQLDTLARIGSGGRGGGRSSSDTDRLVEAIENNRGLFVHVSSREDLEHAFRAIDRELRR